MQDGTHTGNTATVSITVTPVNDAPVAESQSLTLTEDTETNFFVRATDVDGNPLTYSIVTFPAHGKLLLGATNFPTLNLTYIPDPNYNGPDSFTFKANDGQLDSNLGTASLTLLSVEDPPVSQDDSYTVPENNTLIVSAENGVLSNDAEGDGQPMAVTLVSGTVHGSLSLKSDGSFTFAPNTNFDGVDSFTYQANDGVTDGNTAKSLLL